MRLIILAVAWVLGISLARELPGQPPSLWLAAFGVALASAIALRRGRWLWLAIGICAFCAAGMRQTFVPRDSEIAAHNGYRGSVTGIVIAEPAITADRVQLRVEAESVFVNNRERETSGLLLVETVPGAGLKYGDRIRATGAISMPASWDTFSYADYLARQGVFSILRNAAVTVLDSGHGDSFLAALIELKAIAKRLIATSLPEPQAGLLAGILLGDESGISPDLADDFSRVGAAHIIAISGFNMVILSGIVIRIGRRLFPGNGAAVTLNALSLMAVYAIFVGGSPGVLRAALMTGLYVIGSQLQRKTFTPASLAFATLLLSAADPNVLLDLGFQLSFFAVLGLAVFVEPFSRCFRRLLGIMLPPRSASRVHGLLDEPLIVSLAAHLATMPLIILYFGRLSLVAIPVNLLIVPAQAAILLLGMAALAAKLIAPVLGSLLFLAELVALSWTIGVVRFFASLDFAELSLALDSRLIQAFYLLMIGGAMLRAARPRLLKRLAHRLQAKTLLIALGGTGLLALILAAGYMHSRPDGRLHLWLLDIGHNNAALIQTPGGAQILVDGGRFPARLLTAIGDRLPFHDRHIEILAITQPDEWDIAALAAVLDRYTVGAALYHGQPNHGDVYKALMERLRGSNTPVVEARAGYRLEFSDGALLEALHPQTKPENSDRLSNQSLVLRLSYGEVSFLLTGDLSGHGQLEMLANGVPVLATVLQVPQHGAARSLDEGFLRAVQPQVALLQVDAANRRGDPDPDIIDLLDGLELYRTDEQGTIHLSADGATLRAHH